MQSAQVNNSNVPGVRSDASAERGLRTLLDVAGVLGGVGLELFEGKSILDIGCGREVPSAAIKWLPNNTSYVGLDVDASVLSGFASEYDGGRIVLRHLDCFNPLSNPAATAALHPAQELPVPDRRFDYVIAVDLTPDLSPEDLEAYLSILGRYAHAETRLVLNCLVDDAIAKFRYKDAGRPYRRSVFSPLYLERQFAEAGWRVERALHSSKKVFRAVPDWAFADLSTRAHQERPFVILNRAAAQVHLEGATELEPPAEGARRRASDPALYDYMFRQLRAASRVGRDAEIADAMLEAVPWSSSRPSAAEFMLLARALARGRGEEGSEEQLWRAFQHSCGDNETFSKTFLELPAEIRSAYALMGWYRREDIETSGLRAAGRPFPFAGEQPERPVLVLAPDEQAARECAETLPGELPLELFLWKRTPARRLDIDGVPRAVRTVLTPPHSTGRRQQLRAVEAASALGQSVIADLCGLAGALPDEISQGLFGAQASEPLRTVVSGAQNLLEDIRAGAYAKVALVCRGEDLDSLSDMLNLLGSLNVRVMLWFPDQSVRDRNAIAALLALGNAADGPNAASEEPPTASDWAAVRALLDGVAGDRSSTGVPEEMVLRRSFRGRNPRLGPGSVAIVASLEDCPIDLRRVAQGLGERFKVVVLLVDSSRRSADAFVRRLIEAGPIDLDVLLLDPRSFDQEIATLKPALSRVARHLFRTVAAKGGLTVDGAPLGAFLRDWWELAFTVPLAQMLLHGRFMTNMLGQYGPRLVIAGPASGGDVAPAVVAAGLSGAPVIALWADWPGTAALNQDVVGIVASGEAELYAAQSGEDLRCVAAFAMPRVAPRISRFEADELRRDLRCGRKDKAIVFAASQDADASLAALEVLLDGLAGFRGYRLLVKADPSLPLSEIGRLTEAISARALGDRCLVLRDYSIYRMMAGADLLVAHVTAATLLFEAVAAAKPVLGICLDGEDTTMGAGMLGAAALTQPAALAGRLDLFLNSSEEMTAVATGRDSVLAARPELRDADFESVLLAEAAKLAGQSGPVG